MAFFYQKVKLPIMHKNDNSCMDFKKRVIFIRKYSKKSVYSFLMWTPNELKRLKKLAPKHTCKELSLIFKKRESTIRRKCHSISANVKPLPYTIPWKNKELNTIKRMAEAGFAASDIAKKLNRSIESTWHKIFALKLKIKRKSKIEKPEDIDKIKQLVAKGYGCVRIARMFDVRHSTIYRIYKKHHIAGVQKYLFNKPLLKKIKKCLYKEGLSIPSTAKKLNITISEVEKYYRKFKLQSKKSRTMRLRQDLLKKRKNICSHCKKIELLSKKNFWANVYSCIECYNKRKQDIKENQRKTITLEELLQNRLVRCKRLSKIKNQKCDLTLNSLMYLYKKQNGKCYYSGEKMEIKVGPGATSGVLSVDRKNSNKGYVLNNVVLCCSRVNTMKNNMPIKTFVSLCKRIVENMNH